MWRRPHHIFLKNKIIFSLPHAPLPPLIFLLFILLFLTLKLGGHKPLLSWFVSLSNSQFFSCNRSSPYLSLNGRAFLFLVVKLFVFLSYSRAFLYHEVLSISLPCVLPFISLPNAPFLTLVVEVLLISPLVVVCFYFSQSSQRFFPLI